MADHDITDMAQPGGEDAERQAAERLEAGRRLFAGGCDFLLSAVQVSHLPDARPAEVAFAGRSNVGKSSLINALTGRKALARTSNTPGRTRELNYFTLGERIYLVDMPGYGFARAPKQAIAAWNALIRRYLAGRASLRRVLLLLDARHGIKPPDLEVMDLLDQNAVVYQAVLTKIDKLKAGERAALFDRLARQLAKRPAAHPRILATSSRSGEGMDELRAEIAGLDEAAA